MTSLAKKQLSKVKFADLSNYDTSTNEYFIPKKVEIKLELNNCYIIKVSDSWRTNKLIANNLNKGITLDCPCVKADICSFNGKLVYINAIGYNEETNQNIPYVWEGWIPLSEISILKKE